MSHSGIQIRDNRAAGRLEAVVAGGETVGHIRYFTLESPESLESPERALVPVHTAVESEYEGQGIAGSLAREFYAVAAREDRAVVPLCPYVARWAARHPEHAPAAAPELIRAARQRLTEHPEDFGTGPA